MRQWLTPPAKALARVLAGGSEARRGSLGRALALTAAAALCGAIAFSTGRPHVSSLARRPAWRPQIAAPAPQSPSEAARKEAAGRLLHALQCASWEADAIEAWDPKAAPQDREWKWREQVLAADQSGELHRSWRAAKRAVALARTPDELGQATRMLTQIECDLGLRRE